ncbi:MAG: proline dehydrogenase [Chlorobiales bacterium]|nr:proline dehydrogenase [Chlorobiales bacterium]
MNQFENTEIAFAHKSDVEMIKSFVLFRTMNSRTISRIGSTLTDIALTLSLPIGGLVKHTLFEQFCGGETLDECRKTMAELARYNVKSILDYSAEGKESEKSHDTAVEKILETLKEAKKDLNIPFIVFKPTGIARFKLLEKVSRNAVLNREEQDEYARVRDRFEYICKSAHDAFIPVMIDAEESWIQPCIDDLATEMMERYNRRSCMVYNTFQMYRKGTLEFLRDSYRRAERSGYFLGVKLVRGAYMEKEHERASEKRYPSPIHATKQDTDHDYNQALEFCAQHIERIAFCAGTHNEESIARLILLMEHYQIKKKYSHVYFSQLYGMGDNISFNLAHDGYNVAKYVPYGPLSAVMPYLFRRADENASMMGNASREYCLIEKELKRRNI